MRNLSMAEKCRGLIIDDKYKELFDTDGKIDDYDKKTRKTMTEFDNMVEQLPEKFWVE